MNVKQKISVAVLALSMWGLGAVIAAGPNPAVSPTPAGLGAVVKPDVYPDFSWAHVPKYMHVRKSTAFTPEELRYLAGFPLITLEKMTGEKDSGSTEEGTLKAARAIKALNPKVKILYYKNVFVHYEGYQCNKLLSSLQNPFCQDNNGNTKLVRRKSEAYDLSSSQLRAWWLKNAQEVCSDPAMDGIFLDGIIKVLEPGYLAKEIGAAKKKEIIDGYHILIKDLSALLGPQQIRLGNVIRARFEDGGLGELRCHCGSYIEAFETAVGTGSKKEYVAKGLSAFQKAAQSGQIIAYTAGLGDEVQDETNAQSTDEIRKKQSDSKDNGQKRLDYLLAIFLVCAEKYSYFYPHNGYGAESNPAWKSPWDVFNRPLGPPKGPATRSGYIYRRQFAHASVTLDQEKEQGTIEWSVP